MSILYKGNDISNIYIGGNEEVYLGNGINRYNEVYGLCPNYTRGSLVNNTNPVYNNGAGRWDVQYDYSNWGRNHGIASGIDLGKNFTEAHIECNVYRPISYSRLEIFFSPDDVINGNCSSGSVRYKNGFSIGLCAQSETSSGFSELYISPSSGSIYRVYMGSAGEIVNAVVDVKYNNGTREVTCTRGDKDGTYTLTDSNDQISISSFRYFGVLGWGYYGQDNDYLGIINQVKFK